MTNTHRLTRIVAGALLSGGVALAGMGLASATAYASPVNITTIPAFNPQPDPPGRQAAVDAPPQSPGVRVGVNPQPDPPGMPVTRGIIAVAQ